jgi:hypothetical protein
VRIDLDDAVAIRIADLVAEDGGAARLRGGSSENLLEAATIEQVVAQHQRDMFGTDKLAADDEGLSEPFGARLDGVLNANAESLAIAQQSFEAADIVRGRDQQDVANTREHQRGQRVVDHRLVVDRQQLLAGGERDGVESSARSPGQDDAFGSLAAARHGDNSILRSTR